MNDLINQVSYPVYLTFFIASILSFVVGAGLALRSKALLQFIEVTNNWVSMRKMTKPLAMPHYIEPALLKRPMLLGTLIVLGAGASVYVLSNVGGEAFRLLLPGDSSSDLMSIVADSIKWFLVTGNALCILAGILMLFFPHHLSVLETSVDHWYSTRQATLSLDTMHMELDSWFLSHPTSSGITLSILSLSTGIWMFAHL